MKTIHYKILLKKLNTLLIMCNELKQHFIQIKQSNNFDVVLQPYMCKKYVYYIKPICEIPFDLLE